jgi:tetratricopeptide (TPR) repeat protein
VKTAMKKTEIYQNEAEFSVKAKRYTYAAKCFSYLAKLYSENKNYEMAMKYFIQGAELWLSLENFYEAGQMYLQAAKFSNHQIDLLNNALSCFYEALTTFTNNTNYFKAGLCAKYIASCFNSLDQRDKQFEHLKLAAELFVRSGMEYLKLKQYDKAINSFEYAVMCYDYLGLDLQSEQIKNKISKYKNNLHLSKRKKDDKIQFNASNNKFITTEKISFFDKF